MTHMVVKGVCTIFNLDRNERYYESLYKKKWHRLYETRRGKKSTSFSTWNHQQVFWKCIRSILIIHPQFFRCALGIYAWANSDLWQGKTELAGRVCIYQRKGLIIRTLGEKNQRKNILPTMWEEAMKIKRWEPGDTQYFQHKKPLLLGGERDSLPSRYKSTFPYQYQRFQPLGFRGWVSENVKNLVRSI